MCEKIIDVKSISFIGHQSERWRYKAPSACAARRHALGAGEGAVNIGQVPVELRDFSQDLGWCALSHFVKAHPPFFEGSGGVLQGT